MNTMISFGPSIRKPGHAPALNVLRAFLLLGFMTFSQASCNTKNELTVDPVGETDPEGGTNPGGNNNPGGNTDPGGNNNQGGNNSGIPASSRNADIVQIEAGTSSTLILLSDNTLWGVGRNSYKQLGLANDQYNTLTLIAENVKFVKSLNLVTAIVKTDGSLWGVGSNHSGMLGNGEDASSFIKLGDNVKSLAGTHNHLLILKNDNTLWGCGSNYDHVISDQGAGDSEDIIRTPVKIADDVKEAAGGYNHTLVLKNDNTLWGRGSGNGLGIGTGGKSKTLTKITDNVKRVAASEDDSAIIKADNSLWVAGKSIILGGTDYYEVIKVPGYSVYILRNYNDRYAEGISRFSKVLENAKDVSFGGLSLVLLNDDTIWGAGISGLGEPGGKAEHYSFVKVADDVLKMSTGGAHSVIQKKDKSLWASGYNSYGQLGDKTVEHRHDKFVPVYLPWKN